MSDRLYVDVAALTNGGINLDEWSRLAKDIAARMDAAVSLYRNAGGGGEMGEQYNTNYKPGEEKALQFLLLLNEIVGSYSDRTLQVARNFEDTNNEADHNAPNA